MPLREYQKVIDAIREKIENGQLREGDRLPTERNIAIELGIGRNSAREALRTLGNMGIVRSRQGSGNYLCAAPADNLAGTIKMMLSMHSMTIREIHDFRFRQELTVCEMILTQNAPDLQMLQGMLDEEQKKDGPERIEADRKIHYELIRLADNRMLKFLMDGLLPVYRSWIDTVLKSASSAELRDFHIFHRNIYTGLCERNKKNVEQAVGEHYSLMRKLLEQA